MPLLRCAALSLTILQLVLTMSYLCPQHAVLLLVMYQHAFGKRESLQFVLPLEHASTCCSTT